MVTSDALYHLARTLKLVRRDAPLVAPGAPFVVDIVPHAAELWIPDMLTASLASTDLRKDVLLQDADMETDLSNAALDPQILGGAPLAGAPVGATAGAVSQRIAHGIVETRVPVELDVRWRVLKDGGALGGDEYLLVNGANAMQGAFLLPVEMTPMTLRSIDATPTAYLIRAEVNLRVRPGAGIAPIESGIVALELPVLVPKVPLPVVFAFFQKEHFGKAAVVVVPADSAIRDVETLKRELVTLRAALAPLRSLRRFARLILGLDALDSALTGSRRFAFLARDEIADLADLKLAKRHLWPGTMLALDTENIPVARNDLSLTGADEDLDASDLASSMLILAPEGWNVELYERKNFDAMGAWLRFGAGPLFVSLVLDLDRDEPRSIPEQTVEVVRERASFHNCVSSLRFRRQVAFPIPPALPERKRRRQPTGRPARSSAAGVARRRGR